MWHTIALTILVVYIILMSLITLYSLFQLQLLFFYRYGKKKLTPRAPKSAQDPNLPFITVQLPIYNELYVVERLIDAVAAFDYPKSRFEIHVLDDSTDETQALIAQKVAHYKTQGFFIEQIRRPNRQGFKAGALRDAMPQARGEFIAIFDADFLPRPDFLLQTLPYFHHEKVGVVQTRWEHINKDYSLLTRLQAVQLDVHFTVEQKGRYAGNCLLQFNGTGGVWRRQTIEDAGGWEADTLTEDLDLSYRAQLKGWEIVFREEIGAPAELPAEMGALKSQQFRWTKGGAETARKMIPVIWKSPISLRQKLHGTVHLMSSSVFVLVFLGAILSVPTYFLQAQFAGLDLSFMLVFYTSLLALFLVYYTANVESSHPQLSYGRRVLKFITLFPLFIILSTGLSLHNTIAVIQGYIGKKTAFIRTPKFNITQLGDSFRTQKYRKRRISKITILEGLICLYFLATVGIALARGETNWLPFHGLYAIGFGGIFLYSVQHVRQ